MCERVCCQALAVRSAWMSETAINTWASRNTQTPALDCIYGPDWDGGVREARGSRHAQLGSGCGEGPTKTLGLLKPPLDESQGAVERAECRPGFRGSGVRPVVNEINPLGHSLFPPATKTGPGPLKHTTLPAHTCAHHSVPLRWSQQDGEQEDDKRKCRAKLKWSVLHCRLSTPDCVCRTICRWVLRQTPETGPQTMQDSKGDTSTFLNDACLTCSIGSV